MLEKLCPDPNSFVSNPGQRYKTKYIGDVQHNGEIILRECGKEDLWMLHNAAREDCDINNIVARFCAGDLSVLSRRQGFYGDFVDLPTNLAEFMNVGKGTISAYEKLPEDVKEKFPDMQSWINSLSNGEFLEFMKLKTSKPEETNE